MTRSELESMRKRELLGLAREHGLRRYSRLRKAELVEALLEVLGFDGERVVLGEGASASEGEGRSFGAEVESSVLPEVEKRFVGGGEFIGPVGGGSGGGRFGGPGAEELAADAGGSGAVARFSGSGAALGGQYPDVDPAGRRAQKYARREAAPELPSDLPGDGELPESYGYNRVFLAARQPDLLYLYWEISEELADRLAGDEAAVLAIRLVVLDEAGGEHRVHELRFAPAGGEYYLPLTMPDARLRAYLGVLRGGDFVELAASRVAVVPRLRPGAGAVRFVTIPLERAMAQLIEDVGSEGPVDGELSDRMAALQDRGVSLPFPAPRPADVRAAVGSDGAPLAPSSVAPEEGISSSSGWRR